MLRLKYCSIQGENFLFLFLSVFEDNSFNIFKDNWHIFPQGSITYGHTLSP